MASHFAGVQSASAQTRAGWPFRQNQSTRSCSADSRSRAGESSARCRDSLPFETELAQLPTPRAVGERAARVCESSASARALHPSARRDPRPAIQLEVERTRSCACDTTSCAPAHEFEAARRCAIEIDGRHRGCRARCRRAGCRCRAPWRRRRDPRSVPCTVPCARSCPRLSLSSKLRSSASTRESQIHFVRDACRPPDARAAEDRGGCRRAPRPRLAARPCRRRSPALPRSRPRSSRMSTAKSPSPSKPTPCASKSKSSLPGRSLRRRPGSMPTRRPSRPALLGRPQHFARQHRPVRRMPRAATASRK